MNPLTCLVPTFSPKLHFLRLDYIVLFEEESFCFSQASFVMSTLGKLQVHYITAVDVICYYFYQEISWSCRI